MVENKKVENIVEWLTCKEYLRRYFSDEQIKLAIERAGLTVSDLTEEKGFREYPGWMKTLEVVQENATINAVDYKGEYKKEYKTNGWLLRVPAQYQGLKHGGIIEQLLIEKFQWFNSLPFMKKVCRAVKTEVTDFTWLKGVPEEMRHLTVAELLGMTNITVEAMESKWKLFEMYGCSRDRDTYEIYLECNGHKTSLYVPFKALMECDWQAIVDRHVKYHDEYYKSPDRRHFFKEAIDVLDSFEAQILKEKLEEERNANK